MKNSGPTLADEAFPDDLVFRQAVPGDAEAVHALMRPYVMQSRVRGRTEAEIIELTRHGFVATKAGKDQGEPRLVGFAAVEIYSTKLAELQCLAVHHEHQGDGIGKKLVSLCVDRARDLGVMEVLAISSSEDFMRACGFDFSLPNQKKAMFCQLRARPRD